eukprot:SAG25_NODE_4104_length_888_cov_2.609632_1_plen_26_part_10
MKVVVWYVQHDDGGAADGALAACQVS